MKVLFASILPLVTVFPVSGICEEVISVPPGIVAFNGKPSYSPIAPVVVPVSSESADVAKNEESVAASMAATTTRSSEARPLLRFRNVRLIVEDPSDAMSELSPGVVVAQNDPVAELSKFVDATPVRVVSGSFKIESKESIAQKKDLKKEGVVSGDVEMGPELAKVNEVSSEEGLVGKVVSEVPIQGNAKEEKGAALKGLVAGGSWELVGKGGFVGDERSRLTSVVSIRSVSLPSPTDVGFPSPRISVQLRDNVQIGALY